MTFVSMMMINVYDSGFSNRHLNENRVLNELIVAFKLPSGNNQKMFPMHH